ncbi:hypothetical protein CJ030_MR6G003739 [Morella rubra]|uniref:C-JID domain-containing protein n=1 Tax=Morella rubra TaxID=262757 RepID=A0A6A1WXG3_9ROSI|nr:hypothetical protein CJ030_MR6G003739 [Morella rubra]
MERLSFSSSSQPVVLSLNYCSNLVEIVGLNLKSDLMIQMLGCNNLSTDFRTSLLQCPSTKGGPCYRVDILPGSEIPLWFSYQTIGSSLSFQVPSLSGCKIGIFVICAVFAFKKESLQWWTDFGVVIHNKTRGYREVFLPGAYQFLANESDHLFLIKGLVIRK